VRIASGSLGQGLSVACGAAQAKKLNNDSRFIFTLMGDGEQQEGQVWEAAMYAAFNKLDNLIAFVDRNNQQIDGSVSEVLALESVAAKYTAFGWATLECDGNKLEELDKTIADAKELAKKEAKPIMVVMNTEMGYPIDFMMGSHKWHGVAPDDAEAAVALDQLEETLGDY
jgi:transketolase